MQVISYTEARNSLKALLDSVVENADYALITRRDAENAVVMSQDYFDSLMETVHLLKSPANVAHLKESIEQYRAGKVQQKGLLDD
ncbi:MAG: type II toxin-antitoxin system prevent-host-death family antitoxin [Gammaproteobacteria bacterium]|nr:type II toxin-antitoxin system prevent-host-death family antitoxin [Gammaproteobacteria bacterium]MBD3776487.1 type II toxin-antitoxin system prevent-host-death family antitoxin [Thiotrichales bacterium]